MRLSNVASFAAVVALSGLAATTTTGCKRIPADLRPLADRYSPMAQKLAVDLAPLCAAGYHGDHQYWPSFPTAVAGPLASDPQVVQIEVICQWPVDIGGFGGNDTFLHVDNLAGRGAISATGVSRGREDDQHEESVTWPSHWTDAPRSVDIEVIRPIAYDPKLEAPRGGRVEVKLGVRAM